MILSYSGKSAPTAHEFAQIASQNDIELSISRSNGGDINWGRQNAQTRLNADISNTTNKRRMRELFAEHGVPTPKLVRGHDYQDPTSGYTLPIVGRPDTHSKGRGFWLCKTETDVVRALQGTRRKRAATHFMEYISKERAPREYRVHIFQGKSIRISEKLFGLIGETAQGLYITGKPKHNVNHVRQAAKDAVAAVGLDFGAVDVLANDTECWVLEVNAAPGLGGSMPKLYLENFKKWYEDSI